MVERDRASGAVAVTSETHILDEAWLAKMSRLAPAFEAARQGERGRWDRHDSRGVSDPRQPQFFPAGQRGLEALAAPLLPSTAPLAAAATQGDEPLLSSIILSTPRRPTKRNAPRMEPWP